MEISSVQVVRYDFYHRDQHDRVESSLQAIYESRSSLDPKSLSFGDTELDTESILFTHASEVDECEYFDSLQTILITDTFPEYFCHSLTIGTLAESEQELMDAGDPMGNRTRRDKWASGLESVLSNVSQSRIQPEGPEPLVIMVEFDHDSFDNGRWDPSLVTSPMPVGALIRGNGNDLDPFGFKPTEQVSAIDSSYLVTYDQESPIDFPLSVLLTKEEIQLDPDDTEEYWSQWIGFEYPRLKMITSVLLVSHWLEWRREAISDIDEELYGYNLTTSESIEEIDDAQDEEQELEELRRRWVESHSATADEFHELQQLLESYSRDDGETQFDQPSVQETNESYLYLSTGFLEREFQTLSTTLDRVETKLEMFISVVQDRIRSNATKSNLQLQSRVTWLTILLAIIAIVEFGLQYLPESLLGAVSEFFFQSGIILAGVMILSFGFVLGYTHR